MNDPRNTYGYPEIFKERRFFIEERRARQRRPKPYTWKDHLLVMLVMTGVVLTFAAVAVAVCSWSGN